MYVAFPKVRLIEPQLKKGRTPAPASIVHAIAPSIWIIACYTPEGGSEELRYRLIHPSIILPLRGDANKRDFRIVNPWTRDVSCVSIPCCHPGSTWIWTFEGITHRESWHLPSSHSPVQART